MKSFALTSALLTAAVTANPTPTEQEPPSKRASLPTVTASGNGMVSQLLDYIYILLICLPYSFLGRKRPVLCPRHRLSAWWIVQPGRPAG